MNSIAVFSIEQAKIIPALLALADSLRELTVGFLPSPRKSLMKLLNFCKGGFGPNTGIVSAFDFEAQNLET